jgi:hypothetical protein
MGSVRSMADLMRGFRVAFMLAAFAFGGLDLWLWGVRRAFLKRLALIKAMGPAAMAAVSVR